MPSRNFLTLLPFILPPLLFCGDPPPPPIRSDWHLRYQPLDDPAARKLLAEARAFARARLGEPAAPVREVLLLRSEPRESLTAPPAGKSAARRAFQLTEIVDSEKGIYAIYLSARPGETAFAGQLAHEASHLQNARLRDVYAEGLSVLFAKEFLREKGLPWDPWKQHFESGKEPLYGASLALLEELSRIAGEGEAGREAIARLLRSAVETPGKYPNMEIDIDRWLETLDGEKREKARVTILKRYEILEALRRKEQPDLTFKKPK